MVATVLPFITKVLPPRARDDVLLRPRLLERVHQSIDRKITLVTAGAGSGKTTLLTEFMREGTLPVCWYSVDEQDRDPFTFLEYLMASLQYRFPGCAEATARRIQAATSLDQSLPGIIGALVTDLHNNVPEPFVLVLDDLHRVQDAPQVLSALDLLLERLPEHCRVVAMGRSEPPLRCLPNLKARREVARITSQDLLFTADEVHAFLTEIAGRATSRQVAEQLTAWCEGWATGLVFAVDVLPWEALMDVPLDGLSRADLFSYLAEEVFGRLSPALQRLLLRCSILPTLDAESCAAVSQEADCGALLAQLAEMGPFVHALGEGRHYAVHGLFQEFLLGRLRADATEYLECHRRAAQCLAQRGQLSEALTIYRTGGLAADAAQLLAESASELYQSGRWTTLATEIDQLPAEVLETWPELLFWWAKAAIPLGQPDQALRLLGQAQAGFRSQGRPVDLARTYLAQAGAYRQRGDPAQAIALSQAALELLSGREEETLLLAEAHHHLGAAFGQQGDFARSVTELEAARQGYTVLGDTYHLAEVHHHLGAAARALGQFPQAMAHYEAARAGWANLGNAGSLASTLNNLGNLYYSMGQFDLAAETLGAALAAANESSSQRILGYGHATLGEVYLAQGRIREALESYTTGLEHAREMLEARLMALCLEGTAVAHLFLGDPARALVLAQEAVELARDRLGPHQRATHEVTLGILANVLGEFPQARGLLEAACRELEPSSDRQALARAHYHLAHSLMALGEHHAGLAALEQVKRHLQRAELAASLTVDARIAHQVVAIAAEHENDASWQRAWGSLQTLTTPAGDVKPLPAPRSTTPTLQAWALGQLKVMILDPNPREVVWATQKAAELCMLLLLRQRSVTKEELIEALWPDSDPARASTLLWTTMYRVRRALLRDSIGRRGQQYHLNGDWPVWFDVHEFERLVHPGRVPAGERDTIERLEEAVDLYQGHFFPQCYADWCGETRQHLETDYLQALVTLVQYRERAGEYQRVAELCRRGLALDPYHEDFHYLLVSSHFHRDDGVNALAAYRRYVDRLRTDLNEAPSPRMLSLCREIERAKATRT